MNLLPLAFTGVFFSFFFTDCRNWLNGKQQDSDYYYFTDSVAGAKAIIQDDVEGFFKQISELDMAIQMKIETGNSPDKVELSTFKEFLRRQVSPWKETEKAMLAPVLNEAGKIVSLLNPGCLPKVSMIKIKTKHYGEHVYYTRGHHILVPENIFESFDEEVQLPILIHEIFHIISKQNPGLRDSLYALIGFKKLPVMPVPPSPIARKILTNPDGVTMQYAIQLDEGDKKSGTLAIPLITSKHSGYKNQFPNFFDYLSFDLYPVVQKNGRWEIQIDTVGNTTLPLTKTPSFFTKIRDNTQYIIHPEEIMADNFMLAAMAVHEGNFKRFSPRGKELIEQVIQFVGKYSFSKNQNLKN